MVSTPITLHHIEPAGILMCLCDCRDALIKVDAEFCRFLKMLVGFCCSDWDA